MKKYLTLKGIIKFREVLKKGKRLRREGVQIIVLKNSLHTISKRITRIGTICTDPKYDDLKIGISVNRKYGSAVERNKAKRRLRSICRELLPELKNGYYIILRPDDHFKNIDYIHAKEGVRSLFEKTGVLKR